ncbi:MAG: hypothetical protein Q4D12_10255 [Bacteroidales bacterium]|nr:hypothetical protein [Bacteroidales bacterium]
MKKFLISAAVVIAAVAGTTCCNYESDNELSNLAKKNVKALAYDIPEIPCAKGVTGCSFLVKDAEGHIVPATIENAKSAQSE